MKSAARLFLDPPFYFVGARCVIEDCLQENDEVTLM